MIKDYLHKGIPVPIAICIILILVILVGGYTWWQYLEIRAERAYIPEVKVSEEDDIADWETYRNEEYGFEIKYPDDWELKEGPFEPPSPVVPEMIVMSSPDEGLGGFNIIIIEIPEEISLEEYIGDLDLRSLGKEFNIREQREIKLTGLFGIQRKEHRINGRYVELVTYLKKDNLIFRFLVSPMSSHEIIADEDQRLNNQILSTFRFLD